MRWHPRAWLEAIFSKGYFVTASKSLATAYSRLTPWQARLVLALVVLVAAAAVAVTQSPLGSSNMDSDRRQPSDVALYRAEVDRVRTGEGYYQAAAAELIARGYPTRSVFNWRTPLPMWMLGKLPSAADGKLLLGGLGLLLIVLAFAVLSREEEAALLEKPAVAPSVEEQPGAPAILFLPIGCALLLTGPALPTVLGDLFVMPVLWSGIFIGLSVCAYGLERRYWGVAFGLAALFFRELALPYCVLAAAMAWWQGRRRELFVWAIGLLAWCLFFAWHWSMVQGVISPTAHAHRASWLQLGGAGFVISVVQMNAYLLLLPQWVTALYLVAALLGMAGWDTPLGRRVGLTTCLYLMAFAVVGYSFNQYWGAMIAPLLCFGVARCPRSLADLAKRVVG